MKFRHGNPDTQAAALKQVLFESDPASGIAHITLNRPEKYNAMSVPMRERITNLLHALDQDPTVRVIVFRAVGKHFSAGNELNEDWGQRGPGYKRFTSTTAYRYNNRLTWGRNAVGQAMARCTKITIMQVHGMCAAWTYLGLATRCDIVIAAASSTFGAPETQILGPSPAVAQVHLQRLFGTKAAKFMGYSGESVSAQYAYTRGLVHRVVDDAELEQSVDALARQLAARPAVDLTYVKARILATESLLHVNTPVLEGLLASHFLKPDPDEVNFFELVRTQGGIKQALAEQKRIQAQALNRVREGG